MIAHSRVEDAAEQAALVRAGDLRAVSRAMSIVERGGPEAEALLAALGSPSPGARVVGITGTPGAGKSTAVSALIEAYRAGGTRVGAIMVDPSSPFTGGAFLGDRIRMQEHAMDPEVFIRSMGNHGDLGGIARAVPHVVRVLSAAGCQRVLVETVGVGQAEIGVDALADTTVVLLTPNAGDAIQGAKAGILEVADVIVVNKADRDGAAETVRDLRYALSVTRALAGAWTPPILTTVAVRGEGVGEVVAALDRHYAWAAESGQLEAKRRRRVAGEIEDLVVAAARAPLRTPAGIASLERAVDDVLAGRLDPHAAATGLLGDGWGKSG
ncbi:MAG TPA: methylmalonyl Co-A mutase-associated GTPase MeaB [Solirubrobacterales bacterium]|nr:methylmalonyl Co-A mutase-associated GTPase MeaB [Solirubrobacterales bacterium]